MILWCSGAGSRSWAGDVSRSGRGGVGVGLGLALGLCLGLGLGLGFRGVFMRVFWCWDRCSSVFESVSWVEDRSESGFVSCSRSRSWVGSLFGSRSSPWSRSGPRTTRRRSVSWGDLYGVLGLVGGGIFSFWLGF